MPFLENAFEGLANYGAATTAQNRANMLNQMMRQRLQSGDIQNRGGEMQLRSLERAQKLEANPQPLVQAFDQLLAAPGIDPTEKGIIMTAKSMVAAGVPLEMALGFLQHLDANRWAMEQAHALNYGMMPNFMMSRFPGMFSGASGGGGTATPRTPMPPGLQEKIAPDGSHHLVRVDPAGKIIEDLGVIP